MVNSTESDNAMSEQVNLDIFFMGFSPHKVLVNSLKRLEIVYLDDLAITPYSM